MTIYVNVLAHLEPEIIHDIARCVVEQGCDPYNTLDAMVEEEMAQAQDPREDWRERSSEADANRYLSMFLRKQAE